MPEPGEGARVRAPPRPEKEIERHVKRTEFGFVAEGPLRVAGDRSTTVAPELGAP
jgi:hypothetical protein